MNCKIPVNKTWNVLSKVWFIYQCNQYANAKKLFTSNLIQILTFYYKWFSKNWKLSHRLGLSKETLINVNNYVMKSFSIIRHNPLPLPYLTSCDSRHDPLTLITYNLSND